MSSMAVNEAVSVRLAVAGATAATSDVNGAWVNSQARGFLAVVRFATANAGNGIKLQHADADNQSDAADIAGSFQASATNDVPVGACVDRPTKKWIRAVAVRGASTVTGDMYHFLYEPLSQPATGGIVVKRVSVPVNGTA